jgi:hypothetical protein
MELYIIIDNSIGDYKTKSESVDGTDTKIDLSFWNMEVSESTARKSGKMKGVPSI